MVEAALTGGELRGEAVMGDLRGLLEASEEVLGSGESVTLISGLSVSLEAGSRSGGGEVGVTSTTLSMLIMISVGNQLVYQLEFSFS